VHGVVAAPADSLPPRLPSEVAMLVDVQRASADDPHAGGGDAERTARLAALSTLAGPARFAHAYDAALGWERRGRPDEAARAFAHVVAAEEADSALRLRARFHLGRLCYERGDLAGAREHLGAVIAAMPDHRRARGYLEAIDRAAAGGAA
jgi:TolA-binding protein